MKPRALIQFDQHISLYAIAGATGGGTPTLDDLGFETGVGDGSDGERTLVASDIPASIKEKPQRDVVVGERPEQRTEYDVVIRYPLGQIAVNHALQVDWQEEGITLYAQNVYGNRREGLTTIGCARRVG